VHRELLCHTTAEIVPHDASARDSESVEQSNNSLCVRVQREGQIVRRITSPVPEQVDDDEPMSSGHLRDDVAPQMSRGGESVKKDYRFARAAGAGGVVVQPRAMHINELTAHERADMRSS